MYVIITRSSSRWLVVTSQWRNPPLEQTGSCNCVSSFPITHPLWIHPDPLIVMIHFCICWFLWTCTILKFKDTFEHKKAEYFFKIEHLSCLHNSHLYIVSFWFHINQLHYQVVHALPVLANIIKYRVTKDSAHALGCNELRQIIFNMSYTTYIKWRVKRKLIFGHIRPV